MPSGEQPVFYIDGAVPCGAAYQQTFDIDAAYAMADGSGNALGAGQFIANQTVAFFGDLNADRTINTTDATISQSVTTSNGALLSAYPGSKDDHPLADFNSDGLFTSADTAVINQYISTGSAPQIPSLNVCGVGVSDAGVDSGSRPTGPSSCRASPADRVRS